MLACTMLNYQYCSLLFYCPYSLHDNMIFAWLKKKICILFAGSKFYWASINQNFCHDALKNVFFNYSTTFISGYCKELEIFLNRGEKVDLLRSLWMTPDHPEWQRSSILYSTSSTGRAIGPMLVHFSRAACHEPGGLLASVRPHRPRVISSLNY